MGFDTNYPFDAYGANYCGNEISELKHKTNAIQRMCKLFTVLNVSNAVLNNVVFFFISIFIDVGLIGFTRQNIRHKKAMSFSKEDVLLAHAIKLKEKVNKMIMTNGLLYFVSHVPEFVVTLLLTVFNRILSRYCVYMFSCVEFIEIAQSFNFFSISLQFFVFWGFDNNFKHMLFTKHK